MSDQLPPCPACNEAYTYEQGALLVCPMCAHEWTADDAGDGGAQDSDAAIVDSVGNPLADGDTVTVVKTVKVKGGGGGVIKAAPRCGASGSSPMAWAITTSTPTSPDSAVCSSSRAW